METLSAMPLLIVAVVSLLLRANPSHANCPKSEVTLCNHTNLLEIHFRGNNVTCDGEVLQSATSTPPEVFFPNKQIPMDDSYYILFITDPDTPYPCARRKEPEKLFLLYIAAGRRNPQLKGRINLTHEVVRYLNPTPEEAQHRYQLFLYSIPSLEVATVPPLLSNLSIDRYNFIFNPTRWNIQSTEPTAVFQFRVRSLRQEAPVPKIVGSATYAEPSVVALTTLLVLLFL